MKSLKFSILVGLLMLIPLNAMWGQSMVVDIPDVPSDTSIVRTWQMRKSVVYFRSNEFGTGFLLVDEYSVNVLKIKMSDNVVVRDFRILHDTVFLSGYYYDAALAQQYGLLARFAIQDFYNGSGNYNWMATLRTPMPDCYGGNCKNQIYDIPRLAVYDSSGRIKIAFIAKNYIVDETTRRVGVGSAKYSGSSWNVVFIYNKYGIEEYTDIIATDDYVVAVARTNDSARLALRIYPKNDFISMSPFGGGTPPSYFYHNKFGQGLSDLEVDENVMATAMKINKFAVSYHYTNSPDDGLAVKTFDIIGGLASLTQAMTASIVRRVGSDWKMRDISYSPLRDKLMVLNDSDGGTIGGQTSIIYQFQLPLLPVGTYYGRYQPLYTIQALDSYGAMTDAYIVSGNRRPGPLSLHWEMLGQMSTCFVQDVILGRLGAANLYTTFMQTNINEPLILSGNEPFVVEVLNKQHVCARQSLQE